MKTFLNLLGASVILWFVAGNAAGQGGQQLRYQPKAGELIYRKVQKMTQTQNIMNKDLKQEMSNTEVSVWSVGEADKQGNLEIRSATKLLVAKMNLEPVGDYSFDSRKDDNEKGSALGAALTPLYERMSTANLVYTISPQGKVLKIDGFKEVIGDAKDNPIAAQFAGGGSEEMAKLALGELVAQFSDKPVNPGGRWEVPFALNFDKFGAAKGKKTYTYEGEGKVGAHKTAKLSLNTEMAFDIDIDMGGAKVTGKMSITDSSGTIHFDPKRGVLVSLKYEYKISGNLNVSAGGMDIPVASEQVQQVTVELLDKLPK
ncbi:MAG: DUF6263 family protein [Gemmataceae bacterium]|nr:DUF6263 family protein [Gemmataceae bacterium]